MARSAGSSIENNFTKGLVTEFSGLNFPENACTETYNCIFDNKGRVARRLGIDYEDSYSMYNSVTRSNIEINEYVWENPGGAESTSFVVVQLGQYLVFYEILENSNLSSNRHSTTINLATYSQKAGYAQTPCQFSSGNGYLFVASSAIDPIYIEYDPDANTLTANRITLYIRDLEGVDDGYANTRRGTLPSPLSLANKKYKYNLYNQGWYDTVRGIADVSESGTQSLTDYEITYNGPAAYLFYGVHLVYPSKAESWWQYKTPQDNFDPRLTTKYPQGDTRAPIGRVILKAFYQDRASVDGALSGIPVITSGGYRPATIAFFAGRVFYAGIYSGEFNQKIYFSQIIEGVTQFGLCYQKQDPTHPDFNDLLPSDGGVISTPDLGQVFKLMTVGSALLVFSSKGVWSIEGSQGVGFAANDYVIRQISSIPSHSARSFIKVEGIPYFINHDGIWTISQDPNLGVITIVSLTDKTIKTYFDEMTNTAKNFMKASYNPLTKTIQWLHNTIDGATLDDNLNYKYALFYNTITQAFYPWEFDQVSNSRITGVVAVRGLGVLRTTVNVVNSADVEVITSLSENVTVINDQPTNSLSATYKYLSYESGYGFTFSQEKDDAFIDWASSASGGQNYDSYFVTGYKVHGEGQKRFQINYLFTYLEDETNSSAFVQGIWDYATSSTTGRYTSKQQVYGTHTNRGYHMTKRRIRGQGYSLQFKYTSEDGKPFTIIGWSAFETVNQAV